MRRRDTLLASLAVASTWTNDAVAQRRPGRPSLGWLNAGTYEGSAGFIAPFVTGMAEFGYVDGRTIDYTFKFANGYVERLPALADELIAARPPVLVGGAIVAAVALRQKTTTIPIVCPVLPNAVGYGLAVSLARPGRNVTGVSSFVERLPSKQLELAMEIVPAAMTIGMIGNSNDPTVPPQVKDLQDLAQSKGLRTYFPEITQPSDVIKAIEKLAAASVDVAIVLQSSMTFMQRSVIGDGLAQYRLPAIHGFREHVTAGGLISYGVDLGWCSHRSATLVHKVLTGTPPGEIPIEFPTKLDLVVNARTAQALGLELPASIMLRADEVID